MAFQNLPYQPGWWWDYGLKRLVINDPYRNGYGGYIVRVHGYGRPAPLTNFTDTTTVDAEWIVDMGYEELKLSRGDQRELASASMGRGIADANRGKIVTIPTPGTIDIS